MAKTIEEILTENSCKTVDEYKDKVSKLEITPKAEDVTLLVDTLVSTQTQVTNLVSIKDNQGTEIGTLRAKVTELTSVQKNVTEESQEKKKENNAPVKTEEQYKAENESREGSLNEAQLAQLDEVYKGLSPDTKKLITKSEEARAAFLDEAIGSSTTQMQETFRRPKTEEKLSIKDQIRNALGQLKPETTPTLRPSGIGFLDNNNNQTKRPAQSAPVITANRGLMDAVKGMAPSK